MTVQTGIVVDPQPPLSEDERHRVASGSRLAIALGVMVAVIVAGLTALIFLLVSSAFDSLTPSAAKDLEWKARRGAIELSKTAELGILVGDATVVEKAAADYISAPDVVNVVAVSADGATIFAYGDRAEAVSTIFARPAGTVHRITDRLVAWSPAIIEGGEIGRVLVAVSTERVSAGDALRRQLLLAAAGGGAVAMLLALGFLTFYIWPVLRLTEEAFTRLEHTTAMALEGARLKAQFLANMSHEIRTPMNAVVGLSRLMLGMQLGPKLRRYAEMIDASSRALLSIINDILDFSKLEAGKYEIHRTHASPTLVVQEVAELLSERAQQKGIDLFTRVATTVPQTVELDADRVRQVLTNLVGNAVKFTEHGEVFIQLSARSVDDEHVQLTFEVHDSGAGIEKDQQDRIFEAFSQADGSLVRKHGGTGLGLAISRQLVGLMDGVLSVDSVLGKGSCFRFVLPAKVVNAAVGVRAEASSVGKRALIACDNENAGAALTEHATAWGMTAELARTPVEAEQSLLRALAEGEPSFDVIVVAETHSGGSAVEVLSLLRRTAGIRIPPVVVLTQPGPDGKEEGRDLHVAAQLAQPVRMSELYECVARVLSPHSLVPANTQIRVAVDSFRGARVLVVDDNHMNQFVAAEQLERLECVVEKAFDGEQALAAVFQSDFTIVFMDCQMPVMDGYTATRKIREREQAEGLRRNVIVALTAHALEGERQLVLSAGMDDYLTKPLRPKALEGVLARWVGGGQKKEQTESAVSPSLRPNAATPSQRVSPERGFEGCSDGLLRLFLEQVPAQLELLDGAMAGGDVDDVRAHAHKLKGSMLTLEATELGELAQSLQHDAERGDLSHSDATLASLTSGFFALEKRVKSELSRRKKLSPERSSHG